MSVSIANGVVAVAPKTIIAGTNITTSETDSTITINATGGGGGGSGATVGEVVVDFGTPPGTNIVTTTITGQTNIIATSKVKAYIMADSTISHNMYEHMIVPLTLTCGNIQAGIGFDIYAVTDLRITGTFNIQWEWI